MSANPRQLCFRALTEWQRGKHFADEILDQLNERNRLEPRDRAWLREAFFGAIRHLAQLDFFIDRLRQGELDPETRAVLRLGFFQLFHMRSPAHAVVNETVDLAGRARGLVNAILRRALREQMDLELALQSAPLPVRLSHPDFLVSRWQKQFGREAAIALCEANNRPAEVFVRANGLKLTAAELARSLPGAELSAFHPRALRVPRLPVSWLRGGLCYVQDPSTLISCDLLDPQPGEQVLDACAAPGGKTTYLAELMKDSGQIIACDLWPSRLEFVQRNIKRLGIANTRPVAADLMKENPMLKPASFDRILLDAPCSNTGVIRRRVDVRWRLTEEDFIRMPEQQFALLRRVCDLLKPGGVLVYSTCSLEREEDEEVVQRALREIHGLQLVGERRTKPWKDGVDGAYAARLVKASGS
jgi:16S rRNA (cytosine967-C5)-methyltransferase